MDVLIIENIQDFLVANNLFYVGWTIILLLPFGDINRFLSDIFVFISLLFLSFVFLGYCLYLLKKEKGRGFYWDVKGIVIDLKGNKIYWNEIEKINITKEYTPYEVYSDLSTLYISRKDKNPSKKIYANNCIFNRLVFNRKAKGITQKLNEDLGRKRALTHIYIKFLPGNYLVDPAAIRLAF